MTYSNIYFRDKAKSNIVSGIGIGATELELPPEDFGSFYNLPVEDQADNAYLYAILRSTENRESIVIDRANSTPAENRLAIKRNVDGYGAFAWGAGTLIFRDLVKTLLEAFVPKCPRETAEGDPNGAVTSSFKGEKLYDSANEAWWIANGTGTTAWTIYAGASVEWYDRTSNIYWELDTTPAYSGTWVVDHWESDPETPM